MSELKPFRNMVRPAHIANLCGHPITAVDVVNTGTDLGLTRGYGYYERHEARKIVAKLIVRTSDPEVLARLRSAYDRLADQSEDEAH